MAGDVENLNSSAINNTILNGLDDNIVHILHQLGIKSDVDILTDLCDLEMSDLSDMRDYLFKSSVDIVKQKIIDQGIPVGQVNIKLRKRNIKKTLSEDIMKLVYYVIKQVEIFPRDVLSMSGQYVDLNISNCTESEDNNQNSDNGLYKKLVDCISDLTNKYDSLDLSHKQLRTDYTDLKSSHSFEIEQLRSAIQQSGIKQSTTIDPNHAPSMDKQSSPADLITPGQPNQNTQTNGSSQGSNSGQRPGEVEAGTQNGSDLGSLGGLGSASDTISGRSRHSTPDLNELLSDAYQDSIHINEQSRSKPVFRDPSKRLIDSSTSPTLVKINQGESHPPLHTKGNFVNTDSRDIQSDTDDDGFTLVAAQRRKSRPNSTGNNNDTLISGIKRETGVKVYVQNLHRKPGQPLKNISDNVRKYCTSKGVRSMNAFTIRNKVADDMVGCQLTVPLRFYDDVIADRFWPSEVTVKKWEDKTHDQPSGTENGFISGKPRSQSRDKHPNTRNRSLSTNRNQSKSRGRSWNRKPHQ